MTVLVTSGNSIKALVAVRSLGRKGINIYVADKQSPSLSASSRYSKKFFLYPSPKEHPDEFIDSLINILEKDTCNVLMPVHSEDTYIIAKNKKKLEKYVKVPLHDYETMKKVNEKGYLIKAAEEFGIPVPKTLIAEDDEMLKNIAETIEFPAVIKLRETTSSIGLSYVYSKNELISKYKGTIAKFNLSPGAYPLIQEYIKGDGYGVSLLFNHGELRAKFTHKRIREYPIDGGPSSSRISIKHPKMEEYAIELMKNFNWHGLAMVEFKMGDDGKPVLMEVNPRYWGSVNQAVQSGVDFPYLLYKMAIDGDVKPVLDYKVGVVTKNIFMDYVSLYQSLKKTKDVSLIKNFFSSPFRDDILSLDDPVPIMSYIRTGWSVVNKKT